MMFIPGKLYGSNGPLSVFSIVERRFVTLTSDKCVMFLSQVDSKIDTVLSNGKRSRTYVFLSSEFGLVRFHFFPPEPDDAFFTRKHSL
jgi:hypothetical protein